MRIIGQVTVFGDVRINHQEAEVLYLLTSYSLAEWFREKCNKTELGYTPDQLKEVLSKIHHQANKILQANAAANEVLKSYTE